MENYGLRCRSMGFLVPEDTPMIWRGPMVIVAATLGAGDADAEMRDGEGSWDLQQPRPSG
jgi:hypothetical protein